MAAPAVLAGYQERLRELTAGLAQTRASQSQALACIIIALAAVIALAYLAISRRSVPLLDSLLPLPFALYYTREHFQRRTTINRDLRLSDFYQAGSDRLQDQWITTGVTGEQFARELHVYQDDLHILGKGSLFQFLCTCRTEVGRSHLASYLLDPADLAEIQSRQQAVQELRDRLDLREQLAMLGKHRFEESSLGTFDDWRALPDSHYHRWLIWLLLVTSGSLALLVLLRADRFLPLSSVVVWMATLLAIHATVGAAYRSTILAWLPATRSVGLELGVLREGLQLLQRQRFQSPKLQQIAQAASQHNLANIRILERLTNALRERDKEWFYGPSRVLLLGTQLYLSIERWRAKHGRALRDCLAAWGEFEALVALSAYAYEHPENAWTQLVQEPIFQAEALGHPLLPAAHCVRNNISLDRVTSVYVLSGSNMAGKSTLLRAIGTNVVLAYAGAPVCAKHLHLALFSVCASLSIVDSLLNGKSKFLAEMDRMRQTIAMSKGSHPVLFLIDEILSGTNSRDRRLAAEAIIRTLLGNGAIGILSTHDLALTELPKRSDFRGANVHMGSRDSTDPMSVDYALKPGVTTETNALAIAKLAGVILEER